MSFSHSASSYRSGFKHSPSPLHSPFLRYFPLFKNRNVTIDCLPWINNAFIYLTSQLSSHLLGAGNVQCHRLRHCSRDLAQQAPLLSQDH